MGEAHELLSHHAGHEEVAAPLRELVAGVDHQARNADRRHPELPRLLHPFAMRAGVDREARVVVHAKADHRPAIIQSRANEVQLVAALRAVLVRPHLTGLGMNREALDVAVTVTPRFGKRAGLLHERIVGGHPAIVMQADHLAVVIGEVLRRMLLEIAFGRHLAIAEREEHIAVLVERDLAAKVAAAFRHRLEQLLDVGQPIVLEARADQRRRRRNGVFRARGRRITNLLRVGDVEQPVGGEVWMHRHFQQATLARLDHRRHPLDWIRQQLAVAHDAQAAGPLGDQRVAAGQECD